MRSANDNREPGIIRGAVEGESTHSILLTAMRLAQLGELRGDDPLRIDSIVDFAEMLEEQNRHD